MRGDRVSVGPSAIALYLPLLPASFRARGRLCGQGSVTLSRVAKSAAIFKSSASPTHTLDAEACPRSPAPAHLGRTSSAIVTLEDDAVGIIDAEIQPTRLGPRRRGPLRSPPRECEHGVRDGAHAGPAPSAPVSQRFHVHRSRCTAADLASLDADTHHVDAMFVLDALQCDGILAGVALILPGRECVPRT